MIKIKNIRIKNLKKMNLDTPILFISGDEDPVGEKGKGVIKAYHKFQNIGMKDVEIKLYPKLRHDILHEKCKNKKSIIRRVDRGYAFRLFGR